MRQVVAAIMAVPMLTALALPSLAQQTQATISTTDRQYLTKDAEGSVYEFVTSHRNKKMLLRMKSSEVPFN